jgi:Bacterial TSP3 repeat
MKRVSILVSLSVGLIVGSGVASAQKTDGPFIMGNIDSSCVTSGAAAGNWTITCGDIAPGSETTVIAPHSVDSVADTDTDGDGISDEYEINVYATDPGVWDTDGDGLSDGDELLTTGSDPFVWDTDGDGVADGDEGAAGTDPLDPESSSSDADVATLGTSNEDSDNDRLADTDEATAGTDPSSPDSDGDGYYDGDEANLGTDPLDSASFPEASESPESP